ncbi:autotransporter domain-containing protein [soil metagenome]
MLSPLNAMIVPSFASRRSLLAFLPCLFCIVAGRLQAQDFVIDQVNSRGTVVQGGSSVGAFTQSPTEMSFQATTTYGNFSSTLIAPNLVFNPLFDQAGQRVNLSYTSKAGFSRAPISFVFFVPNTTTFGADPVVFDGPSSLDFVNLGGSVRFSGSLTSDSGGAATITGLVGGGTGTYSVSLRPDADTLVVARSTGLTSGSDTGTSRLILNAGSALTVAAGSGTFTLSPDASSYGILQIGHGGAAGSVLASEITGGVGGGQVAFDQSDEITFAPLLTGNLSLLKTGPGTVVLAHANTYTAGTILDAGVLATQDPLALGNGPITATNTSTLLVYDNLTVSSGSIGVVSGTLTVAGGNAAANVTTPGNLTKLGPGTLSLLAKVIVNGNANVTAGTLSVDGLLTAQNVVVDQAAFLKGHGVILGNVLNHGDVAPGNSPGTLTIQGNYTQSSSGSLDIEIASPTVLDQLIVSGRASLAGTLNIISYHGYKLEFGQQYTFLQAGSVSGGFDSITAPSGFRGRILENGSTLTLVIAPQSYTQLAVTQNQKNVGQALNSYISATKGDKLTVSTALDLLTAAEGPRALNQVAPNFYESLGTTAIELANAQNQILSQRMSAVRLGARGFSSVGLQAVLVNDKDGKSVLDAKGEQDILKLTPETRWGVWVQGSGIFAKVTNISDVPNYHYASGGFTAGADYSWNEHLSTGFYGGYQGTYAKYGGSGGSNTINSALFGGYATYAQDGFYSDAIIGGGYSSYNVRRPIQFGSIDRTATAKPDGGQFTTYLDAGYDWHVGGFTFGPLVAGQYTYVGLAPFTEDGASSLDLHVDQQDVSSLRTNLGGRIAYTWNITPNLALIPEGRMFWQHEFLNNSRTIGASLDGSSGPGFNYQTANPGRDSVLATAGLVAQIGTRWNGNFYYTADFGNQSFVSHMISAGLEWKF